jgi:diguanylate cyclase (GGDEF)-like protein
MRKIGAIATAFLAMTTIAGSAEAVAAPAERSAPAGTFDAHVAAAKAAMMADPNEALNNARAAIRLSRDHPSPSERVAGELTGQWLEGEALMRINRPLEAKPVIETALQRIAQHQPKTKLHADLLKARAGIATVSGDVQAALENLITAHDMYRALGEPRSQAIVLQNIGSIYQQARDFNRALLYYDQAGEAYSEDPSLAVANHNNRANSLKELGRLPEAEAEFRRALALAREIDSSTLEVRILTNIAAAQVAAGKLTQADATARAALRLAVGEDATWQPFLWGVRAQVALANEDFVTAERLIESTFAGVDIETSIMPFRDFHDTAHRIYQSRGRFADALAHLSALKRLDTEAREVAASANSALMAARFDAANQQLRITKLKAEQLQREKVIEASRERMENLMLYGGLSAAALLIILGAGLAALITVRRSRNKVKAANVQLTHAARHDALTGLVNRSYIRELLAQALQAGCNTGERCALMLIDLDRFKEVNDTLGHWAGDEVLRGVGMRLTDLLPKGSYPARLGGDEFGAVVPIADSAMLAELADKIVDAVAAPFSLGGTHTVVGASVGIAISGIDGDTVELLTRNADLALYHAKQTGRGKHSFYAPAMTAEANERRELERDLRKALAEDQFSLMYQPIVDSDGERLVAYEALLRWNHPTRGQVPPSEFIYIAEEAGIIRQIGDWVIRSACREAVSWPEHIKVAINLSAVQVEAEGLISIVLNTLASTGLAPERLEFEVTETVFLRQGPRTKSTLDQLRTIGVSLALDDFGTGYSSLGYLQHADFAKIKIDRSFVKSAAEGCHESIAIIQAIVTLATSLGMTTTAEGVETEVEKALVRGLGCSQLQGFLLGRPEAKSYASRGRRVA